MPRFYLDLRAHARATRKGQTPWTPAIAVVYQVDEGLRLMSRRGRRARLRPPRGVRRRGAGRAGGAGLRAVRRPARRLADRHRRAGAGGSRLEGVQRRAEAAGLVLAGGQGKLAGKIFRLGHLGSVTVEEDLGELERAHRAEDLLDA